MVFKKFAFLAALLISSTSLAEIYHFTITNVRLLPPGRHLLEISIVRQDTSFSSQEYLSSEQMTPILSHLKLATPEDLIGQSFSSSSPKARDAINEFRLNALYSGKYSPPTLDQFEDFLAASFTESLCPNVYDFSDRKNLYSILSNIPIYPDAENRSAWIEKFNSRLKEKAKENPPYSISLISDLKERRIGGDAIIGMLDYYFLKDSTGKNILKFTVGAYENGFYCEKI